MKRLWACIALLSLAAAGCTREPEETGPRYGMAPKEAGVAVYSLAVHPLHNPDKLLRAYQPLVDYLNARLPEAKLTLEASRDYASFEAKYRQRGPALLLPNPWQTLQAQGLGYRVIAMAGEPGDFKGIFVVRKDSGISEPADLKGRAVSYPSPTALAACIMPQYFLHRRGLDVNRDIENRYVGSQESAVLNAYMGKTAAGATWPPPWRAFQKEHPGEAAELKVIWETEALVNNSVMVRDDLPAELGERLTKLLVELAESEAGKTILAGMETARFLPASDRDYEVVRAYVERFEREVRKVELK